MLARVAVTEYTRYQMISVTDWLAEGDSLLTVGEAALALGVDASHLRLLLRQGKVGGHRLGSQWVLSGAAIEQYRDRPRSIGRPFSEKIAWSLLLRREGREVPWPLHREEQARVARYVQQPLSSLAQRLRGRAHAERLSVGPHVLERLHEHPRWRLGGVSESAGSRLTVVYVPKAAFEALLDDTNAVGDLEQPNLIAQVVSDERWPFDSAPTGSSVWPTVAELDRYDTGQLLYPDQVVNAALR